MTFFSVWKLVTSAWAFPRTSFVPGWVEGIWEEKLSLEALGISKKLALTVLWEVS